MPTTFANTINGNEILAKRSQCDYAGQDIQQTYATKAEVTTGLSGKQDTISDLATIRSGAQLGSTAVQPGDLATVATTGAYSDLTGTPTIPSGTQLVPAATSADADKVLTVDSLGIPAWAASQGLFIAQYDTTTYNEVDAAASAGKIVYCYVNGRFAFLAYKNTAGDNNYEFQYYRSASSGTDSVFVYKVRQTGWTTTERTVKAGNISYPVTAVNVNGSSAMTGTVANITIPAAPTVDQTYDGTSTNAQSGTAVAGAIATKEDAFDVGTGLEMDTSGSTPTLQVEAPVDIVAGPGIVIDNPDGNTLRVSQAANDEVVLFTKTLNDNLWTSESLSESIANFERIRITWARLNTICPIVCTEHYVSDINNVEQIMGLDADISGAIYRYMTKYKINGSTYSESAARYYTYGGTINGWQTNNCWCHPIRIVGIHRIAGGN